MSLADEQAALVAALTAGAPVPPGFDTGRVNAAAEALLRKRLHAVIRHRPLLLREPADRRVFLDWARNRPGRGSRYDLRDFTRYLRRTSTTR